ncbi:hypothetical protein ANCCAN_21141 [Ancylostoma caninum]|uniref:Uncharacterized protein n=1 Tax=Ancylostoma caninum TaxID=29170 RepID=A0A368FQD9_ANCCA|nr:hypothetical protein ANCCAN_21141 [Ancylostoma caninum]
MTNIYGYTALFDAFKAFAIAGRHVLNSTGNLSSVKDGKKIWNAMRRMTFSGMISNNSSGSGTVMFDDLAERIPFYSAFFVDKNKNQVTRFADMVPRMIKTCDSVKTGSRCYEIKVSELLSGFWRATDGDASMTASICGSRGEKCNYKLIITSALAVICFLFAILGAWATRRYCETRALNSMPWRIFRDDMQIIDEEQAKSMLSLTSQRTKLSSNNAMSLKHHAVIGVNTHATYHMYEQRRAIKFNRADLTLLTRMKQMVHDNLNPFLGMAFNEKNEVLLLWKFCSRGTLQGLEYLHLSNIGYHGSLTTWAALIDRNWMVKLTDYGILVNLRCGEKVGEAWQYQ